MKTEKQTLHPGIVALDEKIRLAENRIPYYERMSHSDTTAEERKLIEQIDDLKTKLAALRGQKSGATKSLDDARARVDQLKKLREACIANDLVAEAVWMKLLLERNPKKSLH